MSYIHKWFNVVCQNGHYVNMNITIPLLLQIWQYSKFDMSHVNDILLYRYSKLGLVQNAGSTTSVLWDVPMLLRFQERSTDMICMCTSRVCLSASVFIDTILSLFTLTSVSYTNQLDNSLEGWSRDWWI